MQKFLRMFGAVGLLAGMLMIGGCGSDSVVARLLGKVIDAPVSGAVVTNAAGTVVGHTDANGNFPIIGSGPFTSNGGTYFPLKADGTYSTVAVPAAKMTVPVGVTIITPLAFALYQMTPTQQTSVLAALGITGGLTALNTLDLTVKTTANASAFIVSNSIGAALTQAIQSGASTTAQINAITSAIATQVVALATATTPTFTATAITTAVTTAIATIPTTIVPATVTASIATTVSAIATGASITTATAPAAPTPSILPTDTGTGSTGTTIK